MFKVPDLRNKILFTLLMLALYRLGCLHPGAGHRPGRRQARSRTQAEQGGVLGFLQLFSGGALTQFAVFALGIMPYITASIIMQILAVVIPKLEQWQEQGAVGQRKITQWTRYLTHRHRAGAVHRPRVPVPQRRRRLRRRQHLRRSTCARTSTWPGCCSIVLTLTAGTALLMWMGELITQRGIGNGMSLLIFASVVVGAAGAARRARSRPRPASFGVILAADRVRRPAGRHRLHRAGPAAHPRAVRQAGGRPADVRRPEHLHPAEGQPGRRDPDHLRQLGALPAGCSLSRCCRPTGWGASVQSWINNNLSARRARSCTWRASGCSSSASPTSTRPSPSTRPSRPTPCASRAGSSPASAPGPQTERYLAKVLNRITLPGALFIAVVALSRRSC